ncbi:ComF family protein [Niallia sp. Krafla_26]|uniref:ComF family protein n=1 Tax=Niallia sp. Krafla_26 TaxID=3064703 RepID=UPI003D17315A
MIDRCLICFTEIIPKIGWWALIAEEKQQTLCATCEGKLQEIEGETCPICSRPLEGLESRFIKGDYCYDCIRWEEDPQWKGSLTKNTSLYTYNEFLQEVIARYKFRGDYILARIFSEKVQQVIKQQKADYLVPIPLSPKRLQERCFNQAEAILLEAGLSPANILNRIHSEKQSKKSRHERIYVEQVFQLETNKHIEGKSILLIDDIYTTGSTLRHAAKVLIENGANSVSSLTIARG